MSTFQSFGAAKKCSAFFEESKSALIYTPETLAQYTHDLLWKSVLNTFVDIEKSIKTGADLSQNKIIQHSISQMADHMNEKMSLLPEAKKTAAQSALKNIQTSTLKKNLTLSEYMEFVDSYFEAVHSSIRPNNLKQYLIDSYLEYGLIPLPLAKKNDLSIEELNYLWAAGILPLGIVKGPTQGDFKKIDPIEFLEHDRKAHARIFLDLLNSRRVHYSEDPKVTVAKVRVFFQSFLYVQSQIASPRIRLALHDLYFKYGHENGAHPFIDGQSRVLYLLKKAFIDYPNYKLPDFQNLNDLRTFIKKESARYSRISQQYQTKFILSELMPEEWVQVMNALLDTDSVVDQQRRYLDSLPNFKK